MTDQPTGGISRVPYCTKVRYGISGAPVLTDDDMDGSHAPGVGVRPTLIELVYSQPRDGKPASVSAAVTGEWMRFGQRDGGEVTTHFAGSVEGWPTWLAEEARLHDPDVVPVSSPPPDQTALRERIAEAVQDGPTWMLPRSLSEEVADAMLAVLPPPADRAAVLREEAALIRAHCPDHLDSQSAEGSWINCHCDVADDMERRATEAQQPDTETRP